MTIRPLESRDVQVYRRLRLTALKECPTCFGASHLQEQRKPIAFFRERIEHTESKWVLGAFVDRTLIAVVGFARDSGLKTRHKGFIWGMYVAPRFRGQGIGRALLEAALARIEVLPGFRWVRLCATATNTTALRLYEQLGFVRFGEEPEALRVGNRFYAEVYLVRRTGKRSVRRRSRRPARGTA